MRSAIFSFYAGVYFKCTCTQFGQLSSVISTSDTHRGSTDVRCCWRNRLAWSTLCTCKDQIRVRCCGCTCLLDCRRRMKNCALPDCTQSAMVAYLACPPNLHRYNESGQCISACRKMRVQNVQAVWACISVAVRSCLRTCTQPGIKFTVTVRQEF
jgi:hypothetical protein